MRWIYILIILIPCGELHAQRWFIGTGVSYCSFIENPGINLSLTFQPLKNLYVGPDISAFLNREETENGVAVKRKELDYNINGHYTINVSYALAIYPLVGLNLSKQTTHPEGENAEKRFIAGLNLGGGLEIELEKLRVFLESKHVTTLNKFDFTLGVVFMLDNKITDEQR